MPNKRRAMRTVQVVLRFRQNFRRYRIVCQVRQVRAQQSAAVARLVIVFQHALQMDCSNWIADFKAKTAHCLAFDCQQLEHNHKPGKVKPAVKTSSDGSDSLVVLYIQTGGTVNKPALLIQ